MDYARPDTLAEATALAADPGRTIIAGGTDFYPARVGKPLTEPILDITRVEELRGIEETDQHYRIGALTTWSEVLRAELPPAFRALQQAASEVGGVQVQNAGTVGGNLCNSSPAADGVPPLLTLDASVELVSSKGTRALPLADFLLDYRTTAIEPGEILASVLVPHHPEETSSAFLKLGSRRYLVISIAMVSALIVPADGRVSEARVAIGACSPVAQRAHALEASLAGAELGPGLADIPQPEHLGMLAPIDDPRGTADYRLRAALVLARRALLEVTS